MSLLVKLEGITKVYIAATSVVGPFNLEIQTGECVAICGASGCGKSTLLKIIGLLETQSQGNYFLEGQLVSTLSARIQAYLRNQFFGFVFQNFYLIAHLTVLENVMLPLLYGNASHKIAKIKAENVLNALELDAFHSQYPRHLSGGQQQRVAIARALVNSPKLILADEPTGALDPNLSKQVFSLLKNLVQENRSVILVTHDHTLAARCDRSVMLA